jgi:hypothetical protein
MVKKLTIGWHTTIVPTIIKGMQFNENSNFNTSAQIFLKSPMKVCESKINKEQIEETKKKDIDYVQLKIYFFLLHP